MNAYRGLVATVCTSGTVKPQFSQSLSDMRDWNSRNGFTSIEYKIFDAKLVEAGRDAVVRHALKQTYDWILMIDADAAGWPAAALKRVLEVCYEQIPAVDVYGAYCQLKQAPYLPTIDTGTGTWEVQHPGQGVLPVIRTGGHFLFLKTPLLARMGEPWFRTRIPYSPAKGFREVDNFSRTKRDGDNPLRLHPEWESLVQEASFVSDGAQAALVGIGEDSGFCDTAKAAGATIVVDTDLVVGHVGDYVITPTDLRDAMRDHERTAHALVGIRGYD